MTNKGPIFLFIWFLISSLCLHADITREPFNSMLPSEQTEQELQSISESSLNDIAPELRARPTDVEDWEDAQKIPLGDFGIYEIFTLAFFLLLYGAIHKRKKQMKKYTKQIVALITFFCLSAGTAQAQVPAIKAINDNYYLKPGQVYTLNITVNDIPGDCAVNPANLVVVINNSPSVAGTTWTVVAGNKIRVLVPVATRGSDAIEYTIRCPGNAATSSAKVYLSYADRPDFVDDATCTVDPPETVWDIKKSFISDVPVYFLANPLAGDLDGDGKPEVVTFGMKWLHKPPVGESVNNINSATVVVFDNQLKLKNEFGILNTAGTDTVGVDNYFGHPLALGDVDQDGIGDILVGTGFYDDFKLRCYTMDGTLKWVSHDKNGTELSCFAYPINDRSAGSATPVIADIDGDGQVEIFAGDRFFDGKTGLLLATIPTGTVTTPTPLVPDFPTTFNWGRGHRQQTYANKNRGCGTYQPVLADVNGDGRLDAVCGNATYDIKINRANPDLSTTSLIAAVALPDGLTSVADINGDGILDVVVVTYATNAWGAVAGSTYVYPFSPVKDIYTTMYAWDGATNRVFDIVQPQRVTPTESFPGRFGSRAFIGDIDGDGKPEICFTHVNMMEAYKYNGTNLVPFWSGKTTSDGSGATTMTMFDFNLDGQSELVYRDETHIRILDKNGDNVKDNLGNDAIFDCFSSTHTEYPIVVDLDGDGHAEIIVSGREISTDAPITNTYLQVFTSKTPDVWAPARSVWNQHSYNPLWINNDLSIPRYPVNPTNVAGHVDGTSHKPFNSFLQQAGWLNLEGESFNKAPDLTFQLSKNQRMAYNDLTNVMTITAFLTNIGSEDYKNGDIQLSLFTYNSATTTYRHIASVPHLNKTIDIYGELELSLAIPNWTAASAHAYDDLILTVNMVDDSPNAPKGYYKNQKECVSWNNMTNKISYISGSLVMCQGDVGTLTISPAGAYDCHWFTSDGNPYPSAGTQIAESRVLTKQTSGREHYLIDVYKKGTSIKISAVPDTLFIYQSPDSLVWTGNVNKDWHNPNNWFNPLDLAGNDQYVNIPGSCTNVLVPANNEAGLQLDKYPNLDAVDTKYSSYAAARCNNVHFDHGGEIQKVSELTYHEAYVKLDIESNRWYCFSPPLRNFYSGDIYKTDGNPFLDGIFVFEKLLSQSHPNSGSYIEGTWGYTFSNPTYQFNTGQGLGVWIDDGNPNANTRISQNFAFPKDDDHYYYYNPDGSILDGPLPIGDRSLSHRFIFEKTLNATTKNVALEVEAKTVGKEILIGNPFMAHLDFDKFHAANSTKIEAYYRIIEDGGTYATYRISGASTGNPVLTAQISPMQSVLVTPKVAITSANLLTANGSMTTQVPGNKLRNSQAEAISVLRIFISDTELRNRTSLIIDPASKTTTTFDAKEDILKLIKSGTIDRPSIYLLSADGKYTDIKKIANLNGVSFGLGFCTDLKGPMAVGFEFEDIRDITANHDVFLVDKYENKTIQMTQYNSIYCFDKKNTDRFVNDRFELQFSKKGSGIEEEYEDSAKNISYKVIDNTLFIMTDNQSEAIKNVLIYDLKGHLVYNQSPNSPTLSITLPSGVFIVKTTTESESDVQKISVR